MTSGSSWCTVYKSFLRIIPIRILSFTFIKLFQCWLGAYLPSAILRDSEVESNRNINKDAKFFSISFFVLLCLLCVEFERDECISTAINCTYERDTSLHSSPVTLVFMLSAFSSLSELNLSKAHYCIETDAQCTETDTPTADGRNAKYAPSFNLQSNISSTWCVFD